MKTKKIFIISAVLLGLSQTSVFSQTFKSIDKARQYFYNLDDTFNLSMVNKDSLFFADYFADEFINCTPLGEINNKKAEIKTLLKLPLLHVERTASKFDIFTYSDKIATLSIIKKLTRKDASIQYVRRTIVHKLVNGKWQIVSGQGTTVLPKYLE